MCSASRSSAQGSQQPTSCAGESTERSRARASKAKQQTGKSGRKAPRRAKGSLELCQGKTPPFGIDTPASEWCFERRYMYEKTPQRSRRRGRARAPSRPRRATTERVATALARSTGWPVFIQKGSIIILLLLRAAHTLSLSLSLSLICAHKTGSNEKAALSLQVSCCCFSIRAGRLQSG